MRYNTVRERWEVNCGFLVQWSDQWNWCWKTFGPPTRTGRWDYSGTYMCFKDEEDVTFFLLRWS